MRFSETLRYNANPDWWPHYVAYDELKLHVSTLRQLRHRLYVAAATTHTENEQPRSPRHESSDEEDDSNAQQAPVVGSTHNIAIAVHRSASKTVLADLDQATPSFTSNTPTAGYRAALSRPKLELEYAVRSNLTGSQFRDMLHSEEELFMKKLDGDAERANTFFIRMCEELARVNADLDHDVASITRQISQPTETQPLLASDFASSVVVDMDHAALPALRRRFEEHYREITETINFALLNGTALDKILKKHDKCSGFRKRTKCMERYRKSCAFFDTSPVERLKATTESSYALLFAHDDVNKARTQLCQGIRNLVAFDRNTIWRDMLRIERKVAAIRYQKGDEPADIERRIQTRLAPTLLPLGVALALFCLVLAFPTFVRHLPSAKHATKYSIPTLDTANRCLALLVAVIVLWATEAIPLYVTSFVIVPASALLHLFLDKNGNPLSAADSAREVFESMMSSTIMLVICVYALGAALSKFGIDKIVATSILSRVSRPESLVLVVMCLSVLVSVFVSNVAAPVLLISVLLPMLQDMSVSAMPLVHCMLFSVMIGR